MATYYVPTGKGMGDLRSYTSLDEARAYAIRKMRAFGTIAWTVFTDKERRNLAGRVLAGRYNGRESAYWDINGHKQRLLMTGKIARRL